MEREPGRPQPYRDSYSPGFSGGYPSCWVTGTLQRHLASQGAVAHAQTVHHAHWKRPAASPGQGAINSKKCPPPVPSTFPLPSKLPAASHTALQLSECKRNTTKETPRQGKGKGSSLSRSRGEGLSHRLGSHEHHAPAQGSANFSWREVRSQQFHLGGLMGSATMTQPCC